MKLNISVDGDFLKTLKYVRGCSSYSKALEEVFSNINLSWSEAKRGVCWIKKRGMSKIDSERIHYLLRFLSSFDTSDMSLDDKEELLKMKVFLEGMVEDS